MDSPRRSPGTKPGFKNGRIKKITHNYASGNTLSAIMVVRAWKVAWAARTAGDLTKVLCRIHSAAIRSRRRPRTATLPPLGIPVRSLLGNLVRHLWSVWPIHPHLSHFSEDVWNERPFPLRPLQRPDVSRVLPVSSSLVLNNPIKREAQHSRRWI